MNELELTQSEVLTASRPVYEFCEANGIDAREVMENILNREDAFEVDNYRFIHRDAIDEIQQEELKSDPYGLGCFNAWFIADNTDLSLDIVEALQSADKYEEIGNHIISNDYIGEMQEKYVSSDGYGHHFNHYDGTEDEIGEYYVFRVN